MHERLSRNRDAHDTLDARRRTRDEPREGACCGYHPRRGGRYDSGEDRRPSLGLQVPQAFGRHILNAAFLQRYRSATNISKYFEETNPRLWLKDYWLACQAGAADNDDFIIHNIPLFLADLAQTWLEHLSPNRIQS